MALLLTNVLKKFIPITVLCIVFIFLLLSSCANHSTSSSSTRFATLYKGKHREVNIQLLMGKKPQGSNRNFYLRIDKQKMPFAIQSYLSFKNEPYLSNSILMVCNGDTVHPAITNAERTYEAGNEIVYMMVFDKSRTGKCREKRFVVNNFLTIGDTLNVTIGK